MTKDVEGKIILFPAKEEPTSTVKISYLSTGKSFYQLLKELDENEAERLLIGFVYEFEKACNKRLGQLKNDKGESE